MRSALDDAEKYVDSMNDYTNDCMSMMNMMRNMRGMGMMSGQMQGMGQGSMMNNQNSSTPNQPCK